ncbi:MAG: nucleotide disphospho-sugar-binding domain-containing protein [Patescibacteria group bacterium]
MTSPSRYRPRILFVSEAVTLAHLARPLALASALAEDEYDVHLAVGDAFETVVKQSAITRHTITNLSRTELIKRVRRGAPLFDRATLEREVVEDQALIRALQPDLIIGDFRLSLGVSARICRVPYAGISNAYWSPSVASWYEVPPTLFTRVCPLPLAQFFFDHAQTHIFAHHTRPYNQVRAHYGLPPIPPTLTHLYTDADHMLYADPPDLFRGPQYLANEHFLGFMPWSLEAPHPSTIEFPNTHEPLCYVALGSSGAHHLTEKIIQAFGALPVRALIGRDAHLVDVPLSPNVRLTPLLSAATIAEKADLLIINGGSTMTSHAITAGKPIIGISDNIDALLNMQRIVASGIGLSFRTDRFTSRMFADGVMRILTDPTFRTAAQLLQRSAAQHDFRRNIRSFISSVTGIQ